MLRILISAAEALGLLIVLVLALNYSVPLVIWVSLGLLLVAAFVMFTGRTAPRMQSRGKALAIGSIAGVCLMASATIYQDQRGGPPSPTFDLAAMIAQSDDLSRPEKYSATLQPPLSKTGPAAKLTLLRVVDGFVQLHSTPNRCISCFAGDRRLLTGFISTLRRARYSASLVLPI